MTAVRRVSSDDLGVVAFVLPGAPNRTFELSEWPDGSFSLEPIAASGDATILAAARARAAHEPLERPALTIARDSRTA